MQVYVDRTALDEDQMADMILDINRMLTSPQTSRDYQLLDSQEEPHDRED